MSMSVGSLALLTGAITASLLGYERWHAAVTSGPEKGQEPEWTPAPPRPCTRPAPAPAEKPLKPPAQEALEGGSWSVAISGGLAALVADAVWLWSRNHPAPPVRIAELCPEFPSPRRVGPRRRSLGSVVDPSVLESLAASEHRR